MSTTILEQPTVLYSTTFPAGTRIEQRMDTQSQKLFFDLTIPAAQKILDQSSARQGCSFYDIVFPAGSVIIYEKANESIKFESDKVPYDIKLGGVLEFMGLPFPQNSDLLFSVSAGSLPANDFQSFINFTLKEEWTYQAQVYPVGAGFGLSFTGITCSYDTKEYPFFKFDTLLDFKEIASKAIEENRLEGLALECLTMLGLNSSGALLPNEQLANHYAKKGDKPTAAAYFTKAIAIAKRLREDEKALQLNEALTQLG